MLTRRKTLQFAASAVAMPFVSTAGWPQSYPSRPVTIVVPFAAGGGADIVARLMGQWLSERIGKPVVIENRPGAATNIATEAVVRAQPDGHTLLLVDASSTVNATLYEKLNFNFIRDIAPVAGIVRVANVLVVNPTFPARTVPEFIAYAKANPGKLNMASGGKGDPPHVSGELFKMMTGVDMAYVPYRGLAPALTDLLSGQVQVIFATMPSSIGFIRDNKLRALAVTTTTRSELLSDIPTLSEFLPAYEASQWYGVGAPKNTPAEIIERINKEINAGLADPRLKVRFTELGGAAMSGSPANFGKHIAEETEKWAKVIKFAAIKAE